MPSNDGILIIHIMLDVMHGINSYLFVDCQYIVGVIHHIVDVCKDNKFISSNHALLWKTCLYRLQNPVDIHGKRQGREGLWITPKLL